MEELALFPLNIFLLPGDYTQLYIFEERYKQLINECEAEAKPFGIPFSHKLNTGNYGSMVEVVEVVKRHPGGEMDIVIRAVGVFQLQQFFYQFDNKLYPGGRVRIMEMAGQNVASYKLVTAFRDFLLRHEVFNSDLLSKDSLSYFEIANGLQMNDMERLDLLRLAAGKEREEFLLNYIRYLELLHEQEKHLYNNLYLN